VAGGEQSKKEQGLEESLAEIRARADAAEQRLRQVRAELEDLERNRPRIDALREVSRGLETLREQGGECPLFGGPVDPERYERLLAQQHAEIAAFDEHLPELRGARDDAEEQWRAANAEVTDTEARLEKERQRRRKQEQAERRRALLEQARQIAESGAQPLREMAVRWAGTDEDDRRAKRIAAAVLLWALLLSILVPRFHLPEPELEEEQEIPERLAKLVVEREKKPEPPPEEVVQEEQPKPEEEPPEEEPEKKPEEKPQVTEKKPEPVKEAPEPVTTAESEARDKAANTGLLAMSDELEELSSASVEDKLGSQADISNEGQKATEVSRDIVTAEAGQSSGGIKTSKLSRNVGEAGGSVGERNTSKVESALAGQVAKAQREARTKQGQAGRTDEEIQIVFDRNKAALYRIYNRALRQDPTLKGKVVLRLTIEPSGRVSMCEIVSSELDAGRLETKITQRVKLFDFGAKDVAPLTITYPIDFLPA